MTTIPRLLLLLLAAVTPAAAAELPKLRLILNWYAQPELGGYYTADLNGFWKKEGIEVTVIQGGPNAAVEKRVMTEANTVGISRNDTVLMARDNGLPLVAVMTYLQHDPQGLMVHDASPVKAFADLEGHTVAVPPGTPWFLYLAKKHQWKHVKVIPATGSVAPFVHDPEYIQEASPTDEPYYAMKLGARPRMLQLSDGGFDIYAVVIARETLAKEHPEWLRAFARGAYAGWKDFYRNPEPTFARLQKENPNLEPGGMQYGYGVLKEKHFLEGDPARGEFLGKADLRRWETMASELLEIGLLKRKPEVSTAFTDAYEPTKVGTTTKFLSTP